MMKYYANKYIWVDVILATEIEEPEECGVSMGYGITIIKKIKVFMKYIDVRSLKRIINQVWYHYSSGNEDVVARIVFEYDKQYDCYSDGVMGYPGSIMKHIVPDPHSLTQNYCRAYGISDIKSLKMYCKQICFRTISFEKKIRIREFLEDAKGYYFAINDCCKGGKTMISRKKSIIEKYNKILDLLYHAEYVIPTISDEDISEYDYILEELKLTNVYTLTNISAVIDHSSDKSISQTSQKYFVHSKYMKQKINNLTLCQFPIELRNIILRKLLH